MLDNSDKMWSTRERNGKPLQCFCLNNPMNSVKRQKNMTPEEESPRLIGVQYDTGKSREIASERMKRVGQSGHNAQLWICLVVKVKSGAVKKNIT